MKSKLPKVLHRLAGKPLLGHVLDALAPLDLSAVTVVVGHGAETVRTAIERPSVEASNTQHLTFALQSPQRGTGHAVLQARSDLEGSSDTVLVVYGDTPLLRTETLRALVEAHHAQGAAVTFLTTVLDDPRGYGRIVRGAAGRFLAIVEEADATPEQRTIREINSGVCCFRAEFLWPRVAALRPNPPKDEYYLTDVARLAVAEGETVVALPAADPVEALGINDRIQLAEAERHVQGELRRRLQLAGVTLLDPESTWLHAGVQIGQDTVVYPNTMIEGDTVIGSDCVIGPGSLIAGSTIGDECVVRYSVVEDSRLGNRVKIGPFSRIRQGAELEDDVYLGNYAEIKKSRVGSGTQMHHFSYVGDATVGRNVNIAAGLITCNFDAESGAKNQTIIEDGAALGSDTMLVAPIHIGARAVTGAGSVVTKDLPPDSVAVGVPAKIVRTRKGK
ncbi:MAG: bifunctional UDP-N-acetylglucosamine diphosphorylase/glucosamine-1-phosphate N-acetyltransferase GlmU [Chloroflexi bacterium]|nr:bifunctional UDP-N-acetylglucosamine diphosphorylase/glucosamine-1-phosphate N-acetyltransferase GlmU [Chloroflexota bacterium]